MNIDQLDGFAFRKFKIHSKKIKYNNSAYKFYLFLTLIFFFSITARMESYALSHNLQIESLKETIVALDIARSRSIIEQKKLTSKQNMSLDGSVEDYKDFIKYLTLQINNYCQDIYEIAGMKAIKNLPCNVISKYKQEKKSEQSNQELRSHSEQIELLDEELLNSFAEFDEMLLKEDEQLASKRESGKNQNNGQGNGSAQSGILDNQIDGALNQVQNNTEGRKQMEDNSSTYAEEGAVAKGKGKNFKIGINKKEKLKLDKLDDDIVARQLKEAAEQESDPVLKEKLWQEYYNYKRTSVR